MIGAFYVRKGGAAFVSGERGVPAGGVGEHQKVLLNGEDYHECQGGVFF